MAEDQMTLPILAGVIDPGRRP